MANRPSSTDPAPADQDPNENQTTDSPPGLGEQFGRTRSALLGLVGSHVRLAKAEIGEIADHVKRAAILGGIALGLLFIAGMLASIGTILWLDQWLFGSIGWGALHGTELLLAVAVTLVLLIIPASAPRVGLAGFVGLFFFGGKQRRGSRVPGDHKGLQSLQAFQGKGCLVMDQFQKNILSFFKNTKHG